MIIEQFSLYTLECVFSVNLNSELETNPVLLYFLQCNRGVHLCRSLALFCKRVALFVLLSNVTRTKVKFHLCGSQVAQLPVLCFIFLVTVCSFLSFRGLGGVLFVFFFGGGLPLSHEKLMWHCHHLAGQMAGRREHPSL